MIIQRQPPDLALITQPDHAGLAADLLAAWRDDRFLNLGAREVILFAVREHDNGWLEPDASPAIDRQTRRPYDFVGAPTAVRQGIWPRGIARLRETNAYAAALVAQHALTILRRYEDDAEWTTFFERVERARDELLKEVGRDGAAGRAEFKAEYEWVHLADTLSLIFCNGWTDPVDEAGYRIILAGDRLRIAPDPFDGATCTFRVRARIIPDDRYLSDHALQEALARAPETWLAGSATGTF